MEKIDLKSANEILNANIGKCGYFFSRDYIDLYNKALASYNLFNSLELSGDVDMTSTLRFSEVIKLVRNFLGFVDKRYADKFNYDWNNGFAKITIDKDLTESNLCYEPNKCFSINIKSEPNIFSAIVLLHEYIHKLSVSYPNKNYKTSTYEKYCEAISILGEFKFMDYLLDNGIATEEELENSQILRKKSYLKNVRTIVNAVPFLELIYKGESLTNESLNKLVGKTPFYDEKKLYKVLSDVCKYTEKDYAVFNHQHVLGTLVASYLYENNISNRDYAKLVDNLNYLVDFSYNQMLNLPTDNEVLARAVATKFKVKTLR